MLWQLFVAAGLAIGFSALSNIFEVALYSLPISHIEIINSQHRRIGRVLLELKRDIHRPITAILTLNTIANTAGAAIVGAMAVEAFGEGNVVWFSAVFTLIILFFSEIIPKTMAATYCRELAVWIALPIQLLTRIMTPMVLIIQALAKLLPSRGDGLLVSAAEIQALARQSHRSGEISLQERRVITNILDLKEKSVRQVMTPITVTTTLAAEQTVEEAMTSRELFSAHSRLPVYLRDQDDIVGIVLRRDLLSHAVDQRQTVLREIMHPAHFVPETARLSSVMVEFFEKHSHLFVVVDEYGAVTGVVSLEDVIEEIVGREIVDETDRATDLRELAKRKRRPLGLRLGGSENDRQVEDQQQENQ
ncbi:MAG: hemolysin family protein [Thermodesulfobacteriota bacterium]